ncbi:MAG: hypothetical protein ABMB14_32260 [Myxococcota bacterium]
MVLVSGVLSAAYAGTCGVYSGPELVAEVSGSSVEEASGLAVSRTRDGVFFTHGDHGDEPVIVAFDRTGALIGEHTVVDAENRDWEDIAAAPCPDEGDCLYIGDIGDNEGDHPSITVYVVREPREGDDRIRTIASYVGSYPDGAQDAEALMVQPCTGRIHLVTKADDGLSTVYRFPLFPEDPVVLEEVAKVEFLGPTPASREVTGGAWDDDGQRLALRTTDRVYEWATDPAQPNAHWLDAPTELAGAGEAQGEAIAYGPDGNLYSTGEGATIPLTEYTCDDLGSSDVPCEFPQTGRSCGCAIGVGSAAEFGGWLWVAMAAVALRRRP